MRRVPRFVVGCMLLAACARAASAQNATSLEAHAAAWERLIAAEDARARTPAQLQVLLDGLRAREAVLRAVAVRGLGRLERGELAEHILPLLRDPEPSVRVAAAHALAQSRPRQIAVARTAVLNAAAAERDSYVTGALLETLGRLPHADVATANNTITTLTRGLDAPHPVVLGALRGFHFLVRQQPARPAVAAAAAALKPLAMQRVSAPDSVAARIRRTATAVIVLAGAHDAATLSAVLGDADAYVRREAAAGLNTLADTAALRSLLTRRVLNDASGAVRYEGVRIYGRRLAPSDGCAPLQTAARDNNAHVALLAIDLLRSACPQNAAITAQLDTIARTLPNSMAWHAPAHALVALAGRDATRARAQLAGFAAHANPFVRTYAAAAAGMIGDEATLRRLAADAHANVRTEAITGLRRAVGRAGDSVYIAQLSLDDSQLIMAATAALDSTSRDANAVPALLAALDRISAQKRETSRDGRIALLQSVRRLGSPAVSARLRLYLSDFDPNVANLAADILQAWTGSRPATAPIAPPAMPLPTYVEAARIAGMTYTVELTDGKSFDVRLLPFHAPTNAVRFARLAERGYFNNLTLHRIAVNFVVQGGSPNANEYAGDGPFTRDEVGVPNNRGTVGLSTRGRDTGDAQIYINMIDNVRLDHDYTIFGEVMRGMDVVDAMLEGAQIRRITARPVAR